MCSSAFGRVNLNQSGCPVKFQGQSAVLRLYRLQVFNGNVMPIKYIPPLADRLYAINSMHRCIQAFRKKAVYESFVQKITQVRASCPGTVPSGGKETHGFSG